MQGVRFDVFFQDKSKFNIFVIILQAIAHIKAKTTWVFASSNRNSCISTVKHVKWGVFEIAVSLGFMHQYSTMLCIR